MIDMIKLKSALSAPSIAGFLAGAFTAGVLYVANHVLHIPILESQVENFVTPFASVAAAALIQRARGPAKVVEAEVAKVEANPLVSYLTQEIASRLSVSSDLQSKLVSVALSELTAPAPTPISPVVAALDAVAQAPAAIPAAPAVTPPVTTVPPVTQ